MTKFIAYLMKTVSQNPSGEHTHLGDRKFTERAKTLLEVAAFLRSLCTCSGDPVKMDFRLSLYGIQIACVYVAHCHVNLAFSFFIKDRRVQVTLTAG